MTSKADRSAISKRLEAEFTYESALVIANYCSSSGQVDQLPIEYENPDQLLRHADQAVNFLVRLQLSGIAAFHTTGDDHANAR